MKREPKKGKKPLLKQRPSGQQSQHHVEKRAELPESTDLKSARSSTLPPWSFLAAGS